jgi:hypothetical protein
MVSTAHESEVWRYCYFFNGILRCGESIIADDLEYIKGHKESAAKLLRAHINDQAKLSISHYNTNTYAYNIFSLIATKNSYPSKCKLLLKDKSINQISSSCLVKNNFLREYVKKIFRI